MANNDLTQPWDAVRATGHGRTDWVVMGQCPERHDDSPEDAEGCSADCPACRCPHCHGEGRHLIAEGLTEEQAKWAVANGTLVGARSSIPGTTLGHLIWHKLQQTA